MFISYDLASTRFLWLHSETGGLNCLRSWKKHGEAVLNEALLKYSPKQISSSKIWMSTYSFQFSLQITSYRKHCLVAGIVYYKLFHASC